ncbi:hypothetical protein MRX96_036473 [Rhipicephalus microplus]
MQARCLRSFLTVISSCHRLRVPEGCDIVVGTMPLSWPPDKKLLARPIAHLAFLFDLTISASLHGVSGFPLSDYRTKKLTSSFFAEQFNLSIGCAQRPKVTAMSGEDGSLEAGWETPWAVFMEK